MKKLYTLLLLLGCFVWEKSGAQCAPDPTVVTINVDLSANPDTLWVLPKNTSPNRNGSTCSGANCIRFSIKVHPLTKEIAFNVKNPEPSGSAYYMVNCSSPTSIGVPLCVAGMTEFCLTYCKPGGDQPEYSLRATKGFGASDDLNLRNNCSGVMTVSGLQENTITWTSIYPGTAGAYNSFLSVTSGNDSVSVTPTTGAPAYIDYKVCGTAVGCTIGNVCDTVRVYTFPELTADITPAVPALCFGSNSSITLDALISGGKPAYTYQWTGPGTFSSTTSSATVSVAGTYSLSVDDQTTCGPVVFTKVVLESQLPNVTSAATGSVCSGVAQTYSITADVASTTFTWSRAAVPGITEAAVTNQSGDTIDEVLTNSTTDPIDVDYVIIPYSNGCTGATFTYTVTVNPTPYANSSSSTVVCSEEAQNYTILSPIAGTSFTWSRPAVSGISEPSVNAQTSTTITEALTNTTASAILVTYNIVPEAAGCTGPVFNYEVTVNPKPVVTSLAETIICNATAQDYLMNSNVAGATFSWARPATAGISNAAVAGETVNPITESLTNTTAAPVSVTYFIKPMANGCEGNVFTYTVTVNPTPTVTSAPANTLCNLMQQNYTITSDVSGATFTWNRATVSGISNAAVSNQNTDIIDEALENTTSAPIDVTYVITPHYDGCDGPDFNYVVTVNPTPHVTSAPTASICSAAALNYSITADVAGTTFTWSRAAVAGISNAAISGQTTNLITETLINTTSAPIDVTYTILPSANDCNGPAFDLVVTVNPTPQVTSSATASICNNSEFSYQITSDVTGSQFTWSRPAVAGISNAAVSNQAGSQITETLVNTTNAPVDVTYNITPEANGCSGESFSLMVTVIPTVTVTSAASATFCSEEAQNYNITSDVAGATFTWNRTAVAGISNAPVSNQTSSTITEALVNTTNAPITVNYTITPSVDGCNSADFTYAVTVNPKAIVSSAATAMICNNTAQNYTITSAVAGTTYTWSRNAVAGISNAAVSNQTTDIITETLVNTTNAPVDVVYTILPQANGCNGSNFIYTVTVNPTATVTSAANEVICSGETLNHTLTSDVSGATFTWSRLAVAGISNAAVTNQSSNTITETLVNTTQAPVTVPYQITPTFNGCAGGSFMFDVTVNPTAHIVSDAVASLCNNTPQNYSIISDVTGTTFTWSRATVPGIANPAVSNQTSNTITEALENTTTAPVTVEYMIMPKANGCEGESFLYKATIHPTTHITSSAAAQICNNTAQNYTLSADVNGTAYTWSRPAITGISNSATTGTGNKITETLENTTNVPVTVTYQITPAANGCNGEDFSYLVTVNPTPLVTSAPAGEVCDNAPVNYAFSSNVASATFTWSRGYVSGIANAPVSNESGNGITEALHNTTKAAVNVTYTIRATANGCTGPTFQYTVKVNPTTMITSADAATICNNTPQQYSLTSAVPASSYIWRRDAVAGIANPAVSNQTSDVISEALLNNTNAPVDVVYSIIPAANGCTGSTFTYTVTVNPTAYIVSDASAIICSGVAQNYMIQSDVNAASFTWGRAAVSGISNTAVSNQNGNLINETLINTTLDPVTVHYEITPRFSGCDGGSFVYAVTVNPTPHVTSEATATICNNTAQNYVIGSDVAGTTFSWSRAAVAGISNPAVSNQPGNVIAESLENTSSTPINVRYVIIPSANGCSGSQFIYTVTVYPTSVVNTASEATICNKTAQNYTIGSNVNGSTYSWSRPVVAGISNAAASGNGNKITETLENTTTAPITVQYQIEPVANGCQGETFTYAVTVNPSPVVTSSGEETICNKTALNYTITSNVPGTTFTWSRATTPGISNGGVMNQAGNHIGETLINTSSNPVQVTYVIIPTVFGCAGNPAFNYIVTVNPSVTVNSLSNARICNKTAQDYLITSPVTGATFTWSRPAVAGISNAAMSEQTLNPIRETLVNTTNQPVSVSYFITPTANDCVSGTFTYTLTVDPTPESPVASSNSPICLGSNLYLKASTVSNASYSWTGPNGFTSNQQNPARQNVTSAMEGQYQVVAIVNGCSSQPAITNVSTSNLSSSADAGSNQVVCGNNAQLSVSGNILGGEGTGIWSTSGSGTFDNPENLNTKYTPSEEDIRSGGVNLTLTTTNTGVCVPASSTMRVTISPIPVVNAGPDLQVCADKKASLKGQVSVSPSAAWTTSGTGTFYPSNTSLNAEYIPSEEDKVKGMVTVKLTSADNGLCLPVEDAATIRIIKLPFVKAGGEITVMEGHKKKITPTVSGNQLQFLWTPNRYLNDNTSQEVIVTGVADEVYTIKVTGEGGCVAQDQVAIKVLKPFEVPNTFTPNGDGVNDTWLIPNLAKYPDCKVQIFNRYGQVVYESHGYSKPWDGLFNGRPLPFGTYYYIIDTGVGGTISKGYVTLIR